jgi:hypothetical protein
LDLQEISEPFHCIDLAARWRLGGHGVANSRAWPCAMTRQRCVPALHPDGASSHTGSKRYVRILREKSLRWISPILDRDTRSARLPNAFLARFLPAIFLILTVFGSHAVFCEALAEQANVAQSSSTERDFRAKPFRWKEEIEEGKLTPLIDREFLLARLNRLLTPVGPWEAHRYIAGLLRPTRSLTYHVIVRYDVSDKSKGFIDIHIPEGSDSNAKPPGDAATYLNALNTVIAKVAKLGDLTPESDASHADLLIYVNLAERLQASEGFHYEIMPRLPKRAVQPAPRADLQMMEYVLPWTFVRLYFYGPDRRDAKEGNFRSIEGGEIWIQYPRRTFWQAEIAQAALDDAQLGARRGLGTTRDSVVSRFRTPHKTELPTVKEALAPLHPHVWFGAGGLADLNLGKAARPHETLLSLVTGVMQPKEGAIYELGGPPYLRGFCGEIAHSKTLGSRLGRAVAMFIGGIEAGALRVAPLGDYTSEFRADPDALLADFSLADYQGSFDQRLDDHLVIMSLEELRVAHGSQSLQNIPLSLPIAKSSEEAHHLAESKLARRVVDRRIDDFRDTLRDIAFGFTLDGGACTNSMELH